MDYKMRCNKVLLKMEVEQGVCMQLCSLEIRFMHMELEQKRVFELNCHYNSTLAKFR